MDGDGRRRWWLAMDAHYYDSKLALGLRERFGPIGVMVFDAFLRACKRSPIEGQIAYSSEPDFLMIIGLAGLDLVDENGSRWELDALWTYLGRMKNTTKTRSGRITHVRSTRWERWQNSRSKPRNTGPIPTDYERDIAPDRDRDRDKDTTPPNPPGGGAEVDCSPALNDEPKVAVDELRQRRAAAKRSAKEQA